MLDKESPIWVLSFAAAVALVCSLLVTTAVYFLRPIQAAYGAVEYNRVVLTAAGLVEPDDALTDAEIVDRFLELETRIVDLELGSATTDVDPLTYDYRALADLEERPRYMPVYVLERSGAIETIVFPVYGDGMWSTIHGAVSLGADLSTITGALFHEHGETPGIGDVIEDPEWLAQWPGTRIFAETGDLCFDIRRRRGSAGPCTIDGVTGATVTVTAVGDMIKRWFGPEGYGPYLQTLTQGQTQ